MLSSQKFLVQNSSDEGFPSGTPGLVRLYDHIFQNSRNLWSTPKYIDQGMLS